MECPTVVQAWQAAAHSPTRASSTRPWPEGGCGFVPVLPFPVCHRSRTAKIKAPGASLRHCFDQNPPRRARPPSSIAGANSHWLDWLASCIGKHDRVGDMMRGGATSLIPQAACVRSSKQLPISVTIQSTSTPPPSSLFPRL